MRFLGELFPTKRSHWARRISVNKPAGKTLNLVREKSDRSPKNVQNKILQSNKKTSRVCSRLVECFFDFLVMFLVYYSDIFILSFRELLKYVEYFFRTINFHKKAISGHLESSFHKTTSFFSTRSGVISLKVQKYWKENKKSLERKKIRAQNLPNSGRFLF